MVRPVELRERVKAVEQGALQVDLADTLEVTDEEGVDGQQITRVVGLDVAFAELRTEAFQRLDMGALTMFLF
jgi:hypothetical protein